METNQKDNYFQLVRGICILAVVLIHCKTDGGVPFASTSATANFFLRSLIAFPVAVLFYLSGRFTHIQIGNTDKPYNLKKRLSRIAVPYLVFSCLYICFGLVQRHKYSVADLFRILLTGEAAIPFWFSVCLLWMTLATPLLIHSVKKNRNVFIVIAFSILFQLAGYFTTAFYGLSQWVKFSPVWIVFYYIGLLVGNNLIVLKSDKLKKYSISLVLVAYCISALESFILLNTQTMRDIAYSQWHFGAFIYAFSLIVAFENYKHCINRKSTLVKIGNYSYGIYFIHPLFISIFNAAINRVNLTIPFILLVILQFLITVCFTMSVIYILKKIIPDSIRLTVFGF